MAAIPLAEPSERQRKRFIQSVTGKDYLAVMKAVSEGMPPNANWKNLLPLRLAVLCGDVDMVALLSTVGADPALEPVGMTEDDPPQPITLGKSAIELAKEMGKDMANPLQRDAQSMVALMSDAEAAKARVRLLQGKVQEQVKGELKQAQQLMALFVGVVVLTFGALWYLQVGAFDTREL